MFKFNLEQIVYYLEDNKIHSAPVLSRVYIENVPENERGAVTEVQKEILTYMGESRIEYKTVHGIYRESQLFESKESLCESLLRPL